MCEKVCALRLQGVCVHHTHEVCVCVDFVGGGGMSLGSTEYCELSLYILGCLRVSVCAPVQMCVQEMECTLRVRSSHTGPRTERP